MGFPLAPHKTGLTHYTKHATDAAAAFGQEDDITVLTITRLATGVESTTLLETPTLVASAA